MTKSLSIAGTLSVLAALQQGVTTAYCSTGEDVVGSAAQVSRPEEKKMSEVAAEIAQLPEQQYFNVWGLDFSPDGKRLAASSPSSHEIHIWDWRNRQVVRVLEKIKQGSSSLDATDSLRYSPDGRFLATCHGRARGNVVVRVWSAETGEIVRDITEPYGGACMAIGFTPDAKSLIWISNRPRHLPGDHLIVYDTATWQPAWGLRTEPFSPQVLSISPDGKLIAVGGYMFSQGAPNPHQILIVDTAKRAIVRTIEAFQKVEMASMENTIERLAWAPDSIHIAASARVTGTPATAPARPDAVRIFDARSGEVVAREQPMQYARIWGLRYTPDGRYLIESGFQASVASSGGARRDALRIDSMPRTVESVIRIWDGQHRHLLQEIQGAAGSIAVTPDGRHLALGGDGMIFIFDLK